MTCPQTGVAPAQLEVLKRLESKPAAVRLFFNEVVTLLRPPAKSALS
jgi:hypothetical protein